MLVEDVLVRIIYMACPETPMILLINRLSRALMPELDKNALIRHLQTSMEFFRHDREAWKVVLKSAYESLPECPNPTSDVERALPFKSKSVCWSRWMSIVKHIASPSVERANSRDYIFYDNLAWRTFNHCILDGKMHLMGGVTSHDLSEAAGDGTWWFSFTNNEWKWAWPIDNRDCYVTDVLCISIRGLPPIYFTYRVINCSQSLAVSGELFGLARNIQYHDHDENDKSRGFGHLPIRGVSFSFLNNSKTNLDLHRRRLKEYATEESQACLSLVKYKRRFIEAELSRHDSVLLASLLVNPRFVGRAETPEELSKMIDKAEHTVDSDTWQMLREARNYGYYE